ncbi:MAG: transporter [Caulobacteraceae bacterium]|nr:transporter [Caulobacteraceae bacterium]
MRGRTLAVASLMLLAGCAVGPRFVPPSTPPSAQGPFVSAGQPELAAQAPMPPLWWRLYDDTVLDSLVQQALTRNQDLKVAAANLAYAQALLEEARAGRFPSTDLTAGGPIYRKGFTSGGGSLQALGGAASTAYSAGLTASYQVDLFGRIRRGIQAARANAEATQAAEDVVRVTVAGGTASAYAAICGLGEQIDVARRSLDLVQQTYDLTVTERDAGALSDFDLAREGVILAQAKAAIPPLEGQRRAALFTLAALIGRTPAQVPAEAATCRAPPRITQALPVGDGAALLKRRPDVREAERLLAAATFRIGVATADLYPTISIGGAVSNVATTVGGLGNTAAASYSIGPLLNWSFPNILVARARVHEAGAQASGALAFFDGVVLQALGDTEKALSTYGAELDHHVALADARRNADEALRLADVQFKAGAASFLDLITAEQTAVAADQAVAQSDQTISADQVAVFQALGGGWEGAPAVAAPRIPGA